MRRQTLHNNYRGDERYLANVFMRNMGSKNGEEKMRLRYINRRMFGGRVKDKKKRDKKYIINIPTSYFRFFWTEKEINFLIFLK